MAYIVRFCGRQRRRAASICTLRAYLCLLASATDGLHQVGSTYEASNGDSHAALWSGTAASHTDLHPGGFSKSDAIGVFGGEQVGYVDSHAALWRGSASSHIDLHPVGYFGSYAFSTDSIQQVGMTVNSGAGGRRAALWSGTSQSFIDLHPSGFSSSEARGVGGGQQVGLGYTSLPWENDQSHALVWSGSSDSVVDLHRRDLFFDSRANATNGSVQVGIATEFENGPLLAMLWYGSSTDLVNLSAFLTPNFFLHAIPASIDGDTVYGLAYGFDGQTYAVAWHIPEPTTPMLLGALCMLSGRRRS
jgi:hypothetical protein